jgi:predicted transcriptional regulator
MKISSVEQAEQAKHLLLTRLKENQTPMSLQDLETNLSLERLSHRTLKEAAWKLVEEGKAQFTPTWHLESI